MTAAGNRIRNDPEDSNRRQNQRRDRENCHQQHIELMGGHRRRYHTLHRLDSGHGQFGVEQPDLALYLLSQRSRAPSGLSLGKYSRTKLSLTRPTIGVSSLSWLLKSRPASNGMPMVRK